MVQVFSLTNRFYIISKLREYSYMQKLLYNMHPLVNRGNQAGVNNCIFGFVFSFITATLEYIS